MLRMTAQPRRTVPSSLPTFMHSQHFHYPFYISLLIGSGTTWQRASIAPKPCHMPSSGFYPFSMSSNARNRYPPYGSASSQRREHGVIIMMAPPPPTASTALVFQCHICITTFNTRKLLLQHIRSESDEPHKPFKFHVLLPFSHNS